MSPRALAAPLHRHSREDEYSFVLKKRMGAMLGEDVVEVGPGELVLEPRDRANASRRRGLDNPGQRSSASKRVPLEVGMAVLAMVKLSGDPEQLLAAKREFMDPVAERVFAECGHEWQVIAQSDDGLVILNLWTDAGGRDRANADPAMEEARQRLVAETGATAEFANWAVVEQKTTKQ
jgi:hypothetical protein